MTPVFVNSATVSAPERFVLRGGRWSRALLQVRFAFLDHPARGPVLIDTGYTARVTSGPGRSLALRAYAAILRPQLVCANPAIDYLASRGIRPDDVRTILISHFHADHVAALKDFRKAAFLTSDAGWRAQKASSAAQNIRHGRFPELVPGDFAERLIPFEVSPRTMLPKGLGAGRDLFGDGSVVAVPLPGHAPGHCGFYFAAMDAPSLYAVDVQWLPQAVIERREPGLPVRAIYDNGADARNSADALRAYAGDFLLCHQPQRHRLDSLWAPA